MNEILENSRVYENSDCLSTPILGSHPNHKCHLCEPRRWQITPLLMNVMVCEAFVHALFHYVSCMFFIPDLIPRRRNADRSHPATRGTRELRKGNNKMHGGVIKFWKLPLNMCSLTWYSTDPLMAGALCLCVLHWLHGRCLSWGVIIFIV